MSNPLHLTWDEFEDQFSPRANHLDDNASLNGWMFETYGQEISYVLYINTSSPEQVWTYIDTDEGPQLAEGYHIVNRIGHVITKIPAPKGITINVWDDDDIYDEQGELRA